MRFLSRLRPIDIVLIAALVLTAVVWVASSGSDGDSSSISDVDLVAWQNARDGVSEAFSSGNLQSAKASLRIAADVVEPANDGGAAGMRAFADALQSVDYAAADLALNSLNPIPANSPFFEEIYFTVFVQLFYPEFPIGQPAPGAEWAHANLIGPAQPVEQYWGTSTWSLPPSIPESAGEIDIALPDLDFAGKLTFAVDGDAIQMSLIFLGPLADLDIIEVGGFWAIDSGEDASLAGTIVAAEAGAVVMSLSPEFLADNVRLLQNADEIGILIDLSGGTRFILRIEVGDSGREILADNL
ncbi:MAG: hypothetical protein ACTSWI_03970 [Alphaproteobacteria bacterium]